ARPPRPPRCAPRRERLSHREPQRRAAASLPDRQPEEGLRARRIPRRREERGEIGFPHQPPPPRTRRQLRGQGRHERRERRPPGDRGIARERRAHGVLAHPDRGGGVDRRQLPAPPRGQVAQQNPPPPAVTGWTRVTAPRPASGCGHRTVVIWYLSTARSNSSASPTASSHDLR